MPVYKIENHAEQYGESPVVTDFDAADDAEARTQLDQVASVFRDHHELRLFSVYPIESAEPIASVCGLKGH